MDVKNLEKKLEFSEKENRYLRENLIKFMSKYPVRVFTCKERNSTSVEFVDGSVVIVKRKKGEKDCLHTAICYAITKNLIGSDSLNRLAKTAKDRKTKKQLS